MKQFRFKNLAYSLAIGLIIVGGALFYKKNDGEVAGSLVKNSSSDPFDTEALLKEAGKDTDGDALRDWEEALWGTDPQNPDTDGDGTPDGEEVATSRDPKKAGPDDKLEEKKAQTAENSETSDDTPFKPDTLTEKFSSDFFEFYFNQKADGRVSANTADILFESLKLDLEESSGEGAFKLSDLRVVPTSQSSIRNYGNAVGANLNKAFSQKKESEVFIVAEAVDSRSEKRLSDLDPIIEAHEAAIAANLKVAVPKDAVRLHLAFLNAHRNTLLALKKIRMMFKDPMAATVGIGEYKNASGKLILVWGDMSLYFNKRGISYSKDESGNLFNQR